MNRKVRQSQLTQLPQAPLSSTSFPLVTLTKMGAQTPQRIHQGAFRRRETSLGKTFKKFKVSSNRPWTKKAVEKKFR